MDIRTTLKNKETFIEILSNCLEDKTKVAMLLDNNGLIRAGGIIKSMELNTAQSFVELQGGLKIVLGTIIAVNEIFSPQYSEC